MDDYLVEDENWTHFDFLMGKDLGLVVNKRLVQVLEDSKACQAHNRREDVGTDLRTPVTKDSG